MKDTDTFRANPEFLSREVAGEFILVPTGKTCLQFNGVATLNQTGAFLWELLKRERTVLELGKSLAEKYGLTEEQGVEDAMEFLAGAQEQQAVIPC
ncbi:MAG: PqqD family protein [Clostridiales bacterium]|nr:PqqD family protein [Clostridiales bacterium]